jgi:hypothetical protein
LRDGLNTRSTRLFNARITPIRANIPRPFKFGNEHQRFHGCLPFLGIVFGLRQLGDVERSVAQGDELPAVGQFDWLGK